MVLTIIFICLLRIVVTMLMDYACWCVILKVRGWVRWMEKVRRIIYRRFSVHTFRRIGIYKVQVSKDMRVDQEIYSYTYVRTCLLRVIYIYNITDIVVESCCYLGYLFFFFFFFYIILNARIREKAQINAVK